MDLGALRRFNLGFTSPLVAEAYELYTNKPATVQSSLLILGGMFLMLIVMSAGIILTCISGVAKTFSIVLVLCTEGLIIFDSFIFVFISLFVLKTPRQRTYACAGELFCCTSSNLISVSTVICGIACAIGIFMVGSQFSPLSPSDKISACSMFLICAFTYEIYILILSGEEFFPAFISCLLIAIAVVILFVGIFCKFCFFRTFAIFQCL